MKTWTYLLFGAIVLVSVILWLINLVKTTDKFFDQLEKVERMIQKADNEESYLSAVLEYNRLCRMRIPLKGRMKMAFIAQTLQIKFKQLFPIEEPK
ncbi:MAG: hypothetical protein ACW964_20475 [Candidatus Hodarchaeales archaeon]|jgi:hypothetical protein